MSIAEREITDAKPSANELVRIAEVRRRSTIVKVDQRSTSCHPQQFKNEKLAKDSSTQAMLIKPETTINRGDLLDERCEKIMKNADMYCIFGLSLGDTDKKWWDILAARMNSSNAHILYYAFTQRSIIHNQDLWDIEREYRNMLTDKFANKTQNRDSYMSRIYVLVNSEMFKLD